VGDRELARASRRNDAQTEQRTPPSFTSTYTYRRPANTIQYSSTVSGDVLDSKLRSSLHIKLQP
jgi:hypothetical protein